MMNNHLQLILRYFRYYLTATNRHGLQGPFAFALNEAVFRRDHSEDVHASIEALRHEMLKDHSKINIRDFGAGFGGRNFHERSISYVARHSAKPPKYARMLYRLVKHLQPAVIVELGTSFGISALYQAAGNPAATIYTLEGCPETAAKARDNFKRFPQFKIEVVEGPFAETLPSLLERIPSVDYVYIDGHHRLEPTLQYTALCKPFLSPNAVVIADDINWSVEMQQAWTQLKADPFFTQSIDVFMMGLLFTNKDLSKENFVVRY